MDIIELKTINLVNLRTFKDCLKLMKLFRIVGRKFLEVINNSFFKWYFASKLEAVNNNTSNQNRPDKEGWRI